jgi:repressor LexA
MGEFDMNGLRTRLQELMDDRNIKRKPLAKAAGLGETAIRDLFNSERNDVRVGTLVRLANYFEISVDDLIEERELPVSGKVGAGGSIIFEPEDDPDGPMVQRPPGASGKILALEVIGNSMFPKYEDGDVIYVRKDVDGILPAAIGDYCAIRTSDGGTYLKILAKGSRPGLYTLRSLNAPDMEDQEVVWAAPVRWVMSKSARHT